MARLTETQRRAQLLDHGAALFAREAVDSLSMAEIAAGAECSKGLLYHYFGSRRGYYVAVLDSLAAEVIAAIRPDEGLVFDDAFEGSVRRFLAFVHARPDDYRLVVRAGLGVDAEAEAVLTKVRDAAASFVALQLGVVPDAALRIALRGWVSFAESAALAWVDGGGVDEGGIDVDAMVTLLVDALVPVRRSAARSTSKCGGSDD